MLRIAAYVSPLVAYRMPTGVGQHILGMFSALQQRDDVAFGIVTPRGREDAAEALTRGHAASRLLRLPFPERSLPYATTLASLVSLDRWLGESDWVYVPVEQPVTTSRRLVVTIHDLYAFERSVDRIPWRAAAGLSWRVRMGRILKRADVIATVSAFTRSRLVDLFGLRSPERIVVVGNGGTEGFSPNCGPDDQLALQRYGLASSSYVLFPGSLTRRKGADLLLEVARQSERRGAGLRFVVIGRRHDADLLAEFEAMNWTRGVSPVRLTGYIPKNDLAALYRHSRAVLFPSRYEGFGLPVVEALASGCPLLISAQPALVEVAAGRATIIGEDPLSVLDAIQSVRRTPGEGHDGEHTWARCVGRLIKAMQA